MRLAKAEADHHIQQTQRDIRYFYAPIVPPPATPTQTGRTGGAGGTDGNRDCPAEQTGGAGGVGGANGPRDLPPAQNVPRPHNVQIDEQQQVPRLQAPRL